MSRLIVKNLPKGITEEKIRQTFNQIGTITDVQLKYTPDGKFRKFGFVGFQNESEAEQAIEQFNKTFINTSRITIEKCASLGDSSKPKAWSKYASDSSAFKKSNKIEETNEDITFHGQNAEKISSKKKKERKEDDEELHLLEKYKEDPLFEEFLQVHGNAEKLKKLKEKQKSNDSDDSGTHSDRDEQAEENNAKEDVIAQPKIAEEAITDSEYMNLLKRGGKECIEGAEVKPRQKMEKKVKEKVKLFTLKLRELPYKIRKKDVKAFFQPNIPFSIRIPQKIHGIAFVGFKTEKAYKKGLQKDKSFIKGKQVQVVPYEVKSEDSNQKNDKKPSKWTTQEEALKNEEDIAESGRIFVRNLSYVATENDIEELFKKYGPLTEVNLPIDSTTRKMKGFGVVTFMMPEHAVRAYSELDGTILHGRMLHLLPGKAKDTAEQNLGESTNFKAKKAANQKSQAGSSHNWNSLFLGHDAVAHVIADSYGTSKETVVGSEGKGSAAVRLALGETQIVAQTRKYLEEQGVDLNVFSIASKAKSKTVILVKNLPSKTEAREIHEIFSKRGDIGRIILPPSGITAIVEFIEPSEARKAFTKLAYSKFKNSPLYLEWAPENSLTEVKKPVQESVDIEKDEEIKESSVDREKEDIESEEEPEPDTTIFVKNLNFQTIDEDLKKHFEKCGKIHYAQVARKKDKNNPGNTLSMGYGFVRFYHKKSCDKALKTMQQSVLDGKSLELKRSERAMQNDVKTAKKSSKLTKQTGSKILVRNVPFQANRKEILELFSTFGEIKALRLPKKMAPGADSHRGFAFVDYVTPSDAKSAFEALSQSTHLYGRRLVLEWAQTEEGVDEIRKRTAEHFGTKEEVKSKKSVFNIE